MHSFSKRIDWIYKAAENNCHRPYCESYIRETADQLCEARKVSRLEKEVVDKVCISHLDDHTESDEYHSQ